MTDTTTQDQAATTTAPAAAPAPEKTKQQLLDEKRAEARAAKAAAKDAQKAATAAKRADGVIGTIRQYLDRTEGTTRKEVLDALVAKFPDRDRDGMAVTVGIQFSRLAKSTGRAIGSYKSEARGGRVYGFEDKMVRPEVVLVGTPEAPATPEPEAPAPAPEAAPVVEGKGKRRPKGEK